ncbi:MAG TPA: PAS domain-containing sensor histidine kinase [Verrucomicrobiae bacterium]|nr:PAS domain-containing sensor histidine kinase [Verrucomicrobiae bacterium]
MDMQPKKNSGPIQEAPEFQLFDLRPFYRRSNRGKQPVAPNRIAASLGPKRRPGRLEGLQRKAKSLEKELHRRKKAELAAKRLAAIVESSDDGIIFKDLNGIIQTWNKGAERLFGYTAREAVGKPITILIPEDYQAEEASILARIRKGERVHPFETIRRRKDGQLITISLAVSPVRDDEGKIVGASKIARDISDKKRAEQAVSELLEREQAASRMKDNFLAMLSHELRSPLSPVLLIASDCAENPEVPAELRKQFQAIVDHVETELRLLEDLTDLCRGTHGKIKLHLAEVDAHPILLQAIETVRSQIGLKRIDLHLDLKADRHRLWADPVRLQQIFWNILRNAVKFTHQGGKITVQTLSDNTSKNFIVKVTDTGIGMSEDELKRIFSAYSQGDHVGEKSARYGGLGLGLSISKTLVELHSGRIRAASGGRNQGSVFTIELPLPST